MFWFFSLPYPAGETRAFQRVIKIECGMAILGGVPSNGMATEIMWAEGFWQDFDEQLRNQCNLSTVGSSMAHLISGYFASLV
jgi:hypothetical protein